MKYSVVIILAVVVPLTYAASLPEPEIPDFVKTIKDLHRGPPRQPSSNRANVETRWITQKLDNFDDSNTATWEDVSFNIKPKTNKNVTRNKFYHSVSLSTRTIS